MLPNTLVMRIGRQFFLSIAAVILTASLGLSAGAGEEGSKCEASPHLLWGDGEHDDTAALNAWFRGETVIWAETHEQVGEEIADRTFLLRSAIYITSGSGRRLARFRMIWPERQETVSGGTIVVGNDPDKPPIIDGITKIGADPDEGVPYETPEIEPREYGVPRHCLTS